MKFDISKLLKFKRDITASYNELTAEKAQLTKQRQAILSLPPTAEDIIQKLSDEVEMAKTEYKRKLRFPLKHIAKKSISKKLQDNCNMQQFLDPAPVGEISYGRPHLTSFPVDAAFALFGDVILGNLEAMIHDSDIELGSVSFSEREVEVMQLDGRIDEIDSMLQEIAETRSAISAG